MQIEKRSAFFRRRGSIQVHHRLRHPLAFAPSTTFAHRRQRRALGQPQGARQPWQIQKRLVVLFSVASLRMLRQIEFAVELPGNINNHRQKLAQCIIFSVVAPTKSRKCTFDGLLGADNQFRSGRKFIQFLSRRAVSSSFRSLGCTRNSTSTATERRQPHLGVRSISASVNQRVGNDSSRNSRLFRGEPCTLRMISHTKRSIARYKLFERSVITDGRQARIPGRGWRPASRSQYRRGVQQPDGIRSLTVATAALVRPYFSGRFGSGVGAFGPCVTLTAECVKLSLSPPALLREEGFSHRHAACQYGRPSVA